LKAMEQSENLVLGLNNGEGKRHLTAKVLRAEQRWQVGRRGLLSPSAPAGTGLGLGSAWEPAGTCPEGRGLQWLDLQEPAGCCACKKHLQGLGRCSISALQQPRASAGPRGAVAGLASGTVRLISHFLAPVCSFARVMAGWTHGRMNS